LRFVSLCFGTVVRLFRARRSLLIENLALRQQLAAIKRRHPRSQLGRPDKLFWVVIRQFWSQWKKALIVVTPETVVRWHQAGFRLYWRLISKVKKPMGRRQTPKQVRQLIFRMVAENTTWGAPHTIHCDDRIDQNLGQAGRFRKLYTLRSRHPPRLVVHCGIPDDVSAFGNYSGREVLVLNRKREEARRAQSVACLPPPDAACRIPLQTEGTLKGRASW
jgi:hypothetical protein